MQRELHTCRDRGAKKKVIQTRQKKKDLDASR